MSREVREVKRTDRLYSTTSISTGYEYQEVGIKFETFKASIDV